MATRHPNAATAYLDQATLSDAFKSLRYSSSPHRPLREWIESVAHDANLCVSLAHLIETARIQKGDRDEMVAWLDSLPLTWMKPWADLDRAEAEHLLATVLGVRADDVDPFTPGMLLAWGEGWSPNLLAEALRDPSLRNAVREIGELDTTASRRFMPDWLTKLRKDRAAAVRAGVSPSELRRAIDDRWLHALRQKAIDIIADVRRRAPRTELSRAAADPAAPERFAQAFLADERRLPCLAILRAFSAGFERESKGRTPGSRRVDRAYASMTFDVWHAAVGGPHCDVFNCDAAMGRCLGDVRALFGKRPPVSRRGQDESAFLSALTREWKPGGRPPKGDRD